MIATLAHRTLLAALASTAAIPASAQAASNAAPRTIAENLAWELDPQDTIAGMLPHMAVAAG